MLSGKFHKYDDVQKSGHSFNYMLVFGIYSLPKGDYMPRKSLFPIVLSPAD